MPGNGREGRTEAQLNAEVSELESRAIPLQQRLAAIRAEVDEIRTELRRRQRQAQLKQRQAVRAEMAAGHLPSLEDWLVAPLEEGTPAAFDAYRFLRESATEIRLGYASASTQSLSFTDGRVTEEAGELASARRLYERGWDLGTIQARGVRIYPAGTRAERVVPPDDIHVELRRGT